MRISDWSSDVCSSDLLAARELRRTLEELVSLGIEPVIFSPPPANGVNIGRCLVKSRMLSIHLDYCNFRYDVSENSHKSAYLLLESIAGDYPVVWLNEMICQHRRCGTHFGKDFIYREIERAHVLNPVTNAHIVCRLTLDTQTITTP